MENKEKSIPSTIKILILGNCAVGKSNILLQFTEGKFNESYEVTMGLNYRVKKMRVKNGDIISVQIWDTSGEERFKSIAKNFYRNAQGALLVYDVTNIKTYNDVSNWMEQLKDNSDKNSVAIILGNKIDLKDSRVVSKEQGEQLAKDYSVSYFETSAKENIGLDDAFQCIVDQIYDSFVGGKLKKKEEKIVIDKSNSNDDNNIKKKKKCC